jgi:hypothetical protein
VNIRFDERTSTEQSCSSWTNSPARMVGFVRLVEAAGNNSVMRCEAGGMVAATPSRHRASATRAAARPSGPIFHRGSLWCVRAGGIGQTAFSELVNASRTSPKHGADGILKGDNL